VLSVKAFSAARCLNQKMPAAGTATRTDARQRRETNESLVDPTRRPNLTRCSFTISSRARGVL
jgi:hypothetical protein